MLNTEYILFFKERMQSDGFNNLKGSVALIVINLQSTVM